MSHLISIDFIAVRVFSNVKIKFSLHLIKQPRHEGVWKNEGTSSIILNLGGRWKRVISSTPRSLYLRYSLDRRLGGPRRRPENCDEKNNSARSTSGFRFF
jgi:hypothetical protein